MFTRLVGTIVLFGTLAWAQPAAARSHPEGRAGLPAMVARALPAVVSITTRQHPYVVHVLGSRTETLQGAVEVVEDTSQKSGLRVCAVSVMGVCIEP